MGGRYVTPQREWVRLEANRASVGFLEDALIGDVVFVELPKVGRTVAKGDSCAVVESTKTIREVYAPLNGLIGAVNDTVYDDPDSVKSEVWLFAIDFDGEPDMSDWQLESEA